MIPLCYCSHTICILLNNFRIHRLVQLAEIVKTFITLISLWFRYSFFFFFVNLVHNYMTKIVIHFILLFKKIFFNVYSFLRDRKTKHEQGKGRERRRHRIWSRFQTPSCQYRARRGARIHELWDHDLSWSRMLKRLSHPGVPCFTFIIFLLLQSSTYFCM